MAEIPGDDLTFKQLVDAIVYKAKRKKEKLLCLRVPELDALERKLQIAAAAVRGCRNSLQPINRLPPEVLCAIFDQTESDVGSFIPDVFSYTAANRRWSSLLHVCRQWRGICARCPTLWAVIDESVITDTYLSRSAASPLTAYLGMIDGKLLEERHFDALLTHLPRLRELHISLESWQGSTPPWQHEMFTKSVPVLESLSVFAHSSQSGILPPLFAGHMPRLRQISMKHYTCWPANQFSNLTHVCLFDQDISSIPTTTQFLDFLESSPFLEELALVRAGPFLPQGGDTLPLTQDRRLLLGHLRELNIGEWPTIACITKFLSYLDLPPHTNLYIWGGSLHDADAALSSLLPANSGLENTRNITNWYLTHYHQAQSGDSDVLYSPFQAIVGARQSLYTYGIFLSSELLGSLHKYSLHNIRSLVLRDSSFPENRFTSHVWAEIFGNLPALEKLRILAFKSTPTTRMVLTALLPRLPSSSKSRKKSRKRKSLPKVDLEPVEEKPELLCPKLVSLGIEHDSDLASIFIAKFLKARKKQGSPIQRLTILVCDSVPRPSPAATETDSSGSNGSGVREDLDEEQPPEQDGDSEEELNSHVEYKLRSDESLELFRKYVSKVVFEYNRPLSEDLMPTNWPTDVFKRYYEI
ncbi:hypothetical protein VKT23_013887 [Stygiomarasmius scandens]|uniref:F-box domain-containing protein n=1 Tax=Marasmiellus scandens TaxID=2682957 RepID=A0ABR1J5S2_9AGAR